MDFSKTIYGLINHLIIAMLHINVPDVKIENLRLTRAHVSNQQQRINLSQFKT